MEFKELEREVVKWGRERGLYEKPSINAQMYKLEEEFIELWNAVFHDDKLAIFDAIGDMMVVMTHIAHFLGTDLHTCYQGAYNEIKDRKGVTVGGVFYKEGDDGKAKN